MSTTQLQNYIAGEWVEGASVSRNLNPSNTGDLIGEFAQASASPVHDSMFEDVFDAAQPKPVTVDSRLDSILGGAQASEMRGAQ